MNRQQRRQAAKHQKSGTVPVPASHRLLLKGMDEHRAGRLEAAIVLYHRALEQQPDFPEALNNLGGAFFQIGRKDDAIETYRRALAVRPELPEGWKNLGDLLMERSDTVGAIDHYRKAVALRPDYVAAWFNLGTQLVIQKQDAAAAEAFSRGVAAATADDPLLPRLLFEFADLLVALRLPDQAIEHYRRAAMLCPDMHEVHNNLGQALERKGLLTEATHHLERAIALAPTLPEAYNNLGNVLQLMGDHIGATERYHQAFDLRPGYARARSNYLLALHYDCSRSTAAILAEHRDAGQYFGPAPPPIRHYANVPDPGRRLRVGYVSPDLGRHSVGHFFAGVAAAHDPDAVAIHCYSDRVQEDELSQQIKASVAVWRKTAGVSDDALAAMIDADAIDILVDLSGHTAFNRLPVFGQRPAPVEVTWLGYPDTTGLTAIDYRLTDDFVDPPGDDTYSSERPVRLPDGFHCYAPPAEAGKVGPLPALATGHVTFGSFNNLAKVNDEVIRLWSEILRRLPTSRLFLKAKSLTDVTTRERVLGAFAGHGITPERIDLKPPLPGKADHLAAYDAVDVALDTFPYNGVTTTCEALWMGVPVVTLPTDRRAGRVGASLLNRVGLGTLVAATPSAYIDLAVNLAADLAALSDLRRRLRAQVAASPLCNSDHFCLQIEAAFRGMWREWCATQSPPPGE